MKNKIAPIEITLHAPIQNILDSSTTEFSQECMKDLELCWYKIDRSANDQNLPDVLVKNATSTIDIEKATNITIAIDERVGNSIENIDITLRGLPDNSTHEQYRDFIFQLIKNIKSSGWKRYYFPSAPRISGSQAAKIDTPDKVLGHYTSSHPWLDPDFLTDIDHWLKISPFYNWYFYNEGAYLHLKAWRHDSKDNPTKTGTYLITMEFMTEREYWVSGFSEDKDKARWTELLPARLKSYQETRRIIEEKARAKGIEIDESYQDPPIHALK
ncbi:hypothetical protein [Pseudomonas mandelii]|uniref:hypothetical protein n=1 Tax=Pseudomonas mandelii TaxID=75612 RepID=UPI0020A1D279|nr:hypothetical protein [Pseudomonas mandelii]MCO8314277.1 hypothetical protein [Pseudomonas mandelii]